MSNKPLIEMTVEVDERRIDELYQDKIAQIEVRADDKVIKQSSTRRNIMKDLNVAVNVAVDYLLEKQRGYDNG